MVCANTAANSLSGPQSPPDSALPRCSACPLRGFEISERVSSLRVGKQVRLAIVSDVPDRAECLAGKPLAGLASAHLESELRRIGVTPGECAVIPVTLCRAGREKDQKKAAECCAPRVLYELAQVRLAAGEVPVLTLGKPALRTVTAFASLIYARGFIWQAPAVDIKEMRSLQRKLTKPSRAKNAKSAEAVRLHLDTLEWASAIVGMTVFPAMGPQFTSRADSQKALDAVDVQRLGRYMRGAIDMRVLDDNAEYEVIS